MRIPVDLRPDYRDALRTLAIEFLGGGERVRFGNSRYPLSL